MNRHLACLLAVALGPRIAGLGADGDTDSALRLRAELGADRVTVWVGDQVFTEYRFTATNKYPYLYPVNGPRSGRSVTAHQTEPFPHHSSIFFGCDRVNGGNYWQEGLDRGRIASISIRLVRTEGKEVVWEQDCRWERPGAEAPFDDHRRFAVAAPSADCRQLDFDITLTARTRVRIEKSNHSLFATRMAPDLAVTGGGSLRNAVGDLGEKGTFGKAAAWADYRGRREGQFEGVAILCHAANRWHPAPWFTRDYGFFSPTPMFWLEDGVEFAAGESLRLRYRVVVYAGAPSPADFDRWQTEFSRLP